MARIEQSVEINASIEEVFWFVVSEWQTNMSFFEGIHDWQPSTGARMDNGFTIRYKIRILGIENPIEMQVSGFRENEGWIANSTKGPKTRGEWRFARKNTRTELTYVLDYQMPIPVLGGFFDTLFVKQNWVRLIDKSLRNLKNAIEKT